MIRNNRIVCNIDKAIYAKQFWENQFGHRRSTKPSGPTSFGQILNPDEFHLAVPGQKETYRESVVDAAIRLGVLDRWFPVTHIQFANNHAIQYTDDKALSLWDAWCAKIFGDSKKQQRQKKGNKHEI